MMFYSEMINDYVRDDSSSLWYAMHKLNVIPKKTGLEQYWVYTDITLKHLETYRVSDLEVFAVTYKWQRRVVASDQTSYIARRKREMY